MFILYKVLFVGVKEVLIIVKVIMINWEENYVKEYVYFFGN